MALTSSTIRPGLLVSLKTQIVGNVSYAKTVLDEGHIAETDVEKTDQTAPIISRWETEKRIENPEEHEMATKTRSQARALITGVCAASSFGLLCPENRATDLEQALESAKALIEQFNAQAKNSRINIYMVTGRIAPDDVEAIRAISSEVRDLMRDMEQGIAKLDVEAVRAAANKARGVASMLSPAMQTRVKDAIDSARKVAREIVKAGEQAAVEIDKNALEKIKDARTAFLDIDMADAEIAVPQHDARAVDFEPDADSEQEATSEPTMKAAAPVMVGAQIDFD